MPLPRPVADALNRAGVAFREDEPLSKKTWWRVGGPADAYLEVGDLPALQQVVRIAHHHRLPVFVLGNASNLLVSDLGIPGLVIRLVGEFTASTVDDEGGLRLGAGLKNTAFLKRAERAGWTGLECLAGIPGTIGGAVRMNAGTRLGEIGDRLIDAGVVMPDGALRVLPAEELAPSYRHCALPEGAILVWARFRIGGPTPEESRRLVEEHLAYRAATQPVDVPTCGSTFRNPPGDAAGRLIDAAGLKGAAFGRAKVSEKHANFIENQGGATAADIRRLIEHVQRMVYDRFEIELQPEVVFAGDWSEWDPDATL